MKVAHRAALPTDDPEEPTDPGDGEPIDPGDGGEEGLFMPSDHTVAEVLAYVEEHPDQADSIRDAEQAGKNRSTLLDALAP